QKQGNDLNLSLGYSHPVRVEPPQGITFEVADPTHFAVTGINKEQVGQIAADVRKLRPPEPYKGKGVRYRNERVRRKAGKAGKGAR
ncbi:MAG: 50S ribosomal protein L6, partial [Candidatus Dormibacteraeota bacterium]|nr:50S ribosomal protein L6 [Candidatus Dormibacteraeota bacterium]